MRLYAVALLSRGTGYELPSDLQNDDSEAQPRTAPCEAFGFIHFRVVQG